MVFSNYLKMTDQVPPKAVAEKANGALFFPGTLTVIDDRRQESHLRGIPPLSDSVRHWGRYGANPSYTFPLQANHTFRSTLSLTHYVLQKGKSVRFHGLDVLLNPVGI